METVRRVLDGHNDTLLDLHERRGDEQRSFFTRSESGHVDLPRAKEGGYAGGFFAVFVPNEEMGEVEFDDDGGYEIPFPEAVDHEWARQFTYDRLEWLYRLERQSDGEFTVASSVVEILEAMAQEAVVAVPHLEGAAAVAPDLSNLDFLVAAGVRSIGIAWSRPNAFATGVPFAFPRSPDVGPGLTEAGFDLVEACNDRGVLVDIAHLNAAGFRDVAEVTDAPLVVSHAAVHELCPSSRNLTDDQLDAVGASGGLVGISFCPENLHPEGYRDMELPLSTLVDHVEYVADRVGVEHVAIGSDFDGAAIPNTIGDVTGLPAVFEALADRGFDADELRLVAHENWLRVLDETWERT